MPPGRRRNRKKRHAKIHHQRESLPDPKESDTLLGLVDDEPVKQLTSETIPNTALNLPVSLPAIQKLLLEANFYPKFENEDRKDDSIREAMKERVAAGKGHVEASLKHSGSLLLWSGGQRFYSKNATDNVYTYVGEILLRQHFVRAWCNTIWGANDRIRGENGSSGKNDVEHDSVQQLEAKYHECSQFISKHRLTCAFEVITAVLGDHGACPKRDFLILTAVSDRASELFYSTAELIDFAQQLRLPHNDAWIFSSSQQVQALFDIYDTKRETGLAKDIVESLTTAANAVVVSMYPHATFQGDILEGLVIRYIPVEEKQHRQARGRLLDMAQLVTKSRRLLSEIPPELPDCYQLVQDYFSDERRVSLILRTNVRDCFYEAQTGNGEQSSTSSFGMALQRILEATDGSRRAVKNVAWSTDVDIPSLTASLTSSENTETRRIATVIQSLTKLKKRVVYSVRQETSSEHGDRWLCIIHVMHDITFQKYRAFAGKTDMSLYRGFVVELSGPSKSTGPSEQMGEIDNNGTIGTIEGPDDILMLKLKFLPYMVRTFGCRNGLGVLKNEGKQGFIKYTDNLLSKWGISDSARKKWKPFFHAWAQYAEARLNRQLPDERNLPQLSSNSYLVHLERFSVKFVNGELSQGDNIETGKSLSKANNKAGLLVFVPGIVGCGKSSLLGSATEQKLKEKLPKTRKVKIRVGDLTTGRFWQVVKKERTKDPYCVYIADKNVPGSASWGVVADVCASTRALGVPLVPDATALKTTQVVGMRKPNGEFLSDRVHIYPFSLRYLAVCMARVLGRPPNSHPGKLDGSTKRAAFVVVKFFCLYRRISAEDFLDTLRNKFVSKSARLAPSPVRVPFFKKNPRPLPSELLELLMETLQVQFYFDLTKVDPQYMEDAYVADLDFRLRTCIKRHEQHLLSMTVDEATSREDVISQILEQVRDLDSTELSFEENGQTKSSGNSSYITLASVDVPVHDVHALLRHIVHQGGVQSLLFAERVLRGKSCEEIWTNGSRCTDKRFVPNTHVTLAHCRKVSQSQIRESFGHMEGCQISVRPIALLWSDQVAALEVTFSGDDTTLASLNEFVHVTVWVEEGASAVSSNDLPKLVQEGKAHQLEILDAVPFTGKVKLWM